ncbi:MAG TPA: caspase family protein, partial [Solirubrobacteraceae bacterium]|nr:caspase family protein [Solirubrobacteraceae bacterium]
ADRPPYDGIVTVGELFDFVQEQVKEATAGRQHPHINADAKRSLALAVTGSLSGAEHRELAGRLAEVAELLGEPTCWRGAAVQYGEAVRLLGEPAQAESCVDHALALYRAGDAAAAEAALRGAANGDVRARLTRGLVQLAGGRADDARKTLLEPKPVEPWAPKLFSTSLPRGRRVALLVGLDSVDPAAFSGWSGQLQSCVAETDALAEVLERDFGFDEHVRLVDGEATEAAFRAALEQLVEDSATCDALVVSFSGHGGQQPVPGDGRPEGTLVTFDGQVPAADIDAVLRRSAAGRTTLIASTAHSGTFGDYASAGGYEALCSCRADELDMDGDRLGRFFEALLPNLKPDVDAGGVERATAAALGEALHKQHPVFAADPRQPLLAGHDSGTHDGGPIVSRVLLGDTAAVSSDTLEQIADLVAEGKLPLSFAPPVACEWWRRGELDRLAVAPLASSPATAAACAAAAAAARGSSATTLPDALRQLERRPLVTDEPDLLGEIRALVRRTRKQPLADDRLRAVLVGLSSLGQDDPGLRIAPDAVAAVRATLLDRGVAPDRVTALVDDEATYEAVESALRRAGRNHDAPVLVYWCGPGSVSSMHTFGGGAVSELLVADLAGETATLVAEGPEAAPPNLSPNFSGPRLTLLSIRTAGRKRRAGTVLRDRLDGRPGKARYGPLTIALVAALRDARDLTDIPTSAIGDRHDRTAAARQPDDDVLLLDPLVSRVDAAVARVRDLELAATAGAVSRLLERRNGVDPEALLQLGILRGELGETGESVDALERAIQQFGADAAGEARARLHLGRVLLDSGLDRARAVSECRTATARDPELVEAWYWLGRAIAELIERETATEASSALRTYVARGAPQGRRSEVRRLLDAMAGKAARADR